jgi:sulfate adenylyltransferase subunit 1 (EFTu-like GTPase family)
VKGNVKVDWYKGDELLEDAGHVVIVDEEDGETFTLALEEASAQDSGLYKCVATNEAGTVTSTATLTVVGPNGEKLTPSKQPLVEATTGDSTPDVSPPGVSSPYFEEPQQDIVYDVSEGDTVSFTLNVHGHPKPEVEWFKDDDKVSSGGNYRITQDGGKHELRLQNMTIEDSGIYKCVATNDEGVDERIFKLDVDGKAKFSPRNVSFKM